MQERQIVILSGNHLCHNPRVIKEATTLANAGYKVQVLGNWFDRSLKARDCELIPSLPFTFRAVVDTTGSALQKLPARLSNKSASLVHRFLGLESERQLSSTISALFRTAQSLPSDVFVAHSELAMCVADRLQRQGRSIGVDLEDWFSEDLLPEARKSRPVRLLHQLENNILSSGNYATCPSRAMSNALSKEFGCQPPAVVYNAFPWSDRAQLDGQAKDRQNRVLPSIHWFSQTLGPGRGLEDLIAALPLLKHPAELHLRGNPTTGFDEWIKQRVGTKLAPYIFIHKLVPNSELLSRIAEHDIGFAGETSSIRSRDLTITNKILYYLLAGSAVVASDTLGQREVAELAPGAVSLYPCGEAQALALAIDSLLANPDGLRRAKAAALHAAQHTFCWERQETALLDNVANYLRSLPTNGKN